MEKRIVNPWQWQDERNYVQAVEVSQASSTLYVAGQAAVHADGTSSRADMKTQLMLAIQNLEQVIAEAGYACSDIVRLTVMHTSTEAFFACFPVLQDWIKKHGVRQVTTVFEVKSLFETLNVELEATLVR